MARSALPFVPSGLTSEAEFNWDSHGVPWTGRLDLFGVWEDLAIILDYKTTSNPAWVKKSPDFLDDVPALLYADGAITLHPEVRHVLGLWVYMLPKNVARLVPFYWPDASVWVPNIVKKELVPDALKMLAYADSLGAAPVSLPVINSSIPINKSECSGLGLRCDYGVKCDRRKQP